MKEINDDLAGKVAGGTRIGDQHAFIDAEKCIACGSCAALCRVDAIRGSADGRTYCVNTSLCDGCGMCRSICPTGAIRLLIG